MNRFMLCDEITLSEVLSDHGVLHCSKRNKQKKKHVIISICSLSITGDRWEIEVAGKGILIMKMKKEGACAYSP